MMATCLFFYFEQVQLEQEMGLENSLESICFPASLQTSMFNHPP